jgi:hypothetical protein
VQDKFPDDVSGAVVGAIFNGHKLAEWNAVLYRDGVGVGGVCGV